MKNTTELWITDKTNKKFFKTLCSTDYKDSEIRNLQRHLTNALKYPKQYGFIDIASAKIEEINL